MSAHDPIVLLRSVVEVRDVRDGASLEAGARRLAASRVKRIMDVVGASVGILALSPLLLLIALTLSLESGSWPIFRQERTGLGGRTFVIFKYRTMRLCEEQGRILQAVPHDPRVTPIGRLLRRTSLDELPQLWNVLRGDMSLIGPRPHAVVHDNHYGALIPDYEARFLAKPGLSGLAQVSGFRGRTPYPGDMAQRVTKDLDYIRRWSIWLDMEILLRTPLVLAFHPMAY